ncbi:hypothetical protein [uncultured Paludibaculum sp.]|uniref:hypothetical protein n=1 Tax=uncultured Paludibaculum sp. TaxID=1765020 RepID=UPI002AAA6D86|nr:hypothetical protein [uncultured Paludibaculum sp.]
MPHTNQCQSCRHFLELPMGNDPKRYFCENPRTKEGPQPIGFIIHNAPACALYESADNALSIARPMVIVVTSSPEPTHDKTALIEIKAVRIAVLVSTLVGLASWLLSHIPPTVVSGIESKLGF